MSRPDPRTLPATPTVPAPATSFDDLEGWADDGDEAATLLRLVGAATLAILALATASVLLV